MLSILVLIAVFVACAMAFMRAQPVGKIVIAALLVASFVLPGLIDHDYAGAFGLAARGLLAAGCFVWVKFDDAQLG